MLTLKMENFAFIDGQNLYSGMKNLGWKLDYKRFRVYLSEKYKVKKAYYFIGFDSSQQKLYTYLQNCGYILIFKPTYAVGGKRKGNVDANLVLQTMLEYNNFSKAVIISSDGDFYCLIDQLVTDNKLLIVLSPESTNCAWLLKSSAKGYLSFLKDSRNKLELKKGPH